MEALAITSGIASIVQLLEMTIKLSNAITKLVAKLQNVPNELRRQSLVLKSMCAKLQLLQKLIQDPPMEACLPPFLLQEFGRSLLAVQKDIEVVARATFPYETGKLKASKMREKIRFLVSDEKALANAMRNLKSSEENLQRIESAVHLNLTYLGYLRLNSQPVRTQSSLRAKIPHKATSIVRRTKSSLLPPRSFLRRSGVYVWLEKEQMADESHLILYVGLCLYLWATSLSVSLALNLSIAAQRDGWTLQCRLRVKNRVRMNSPLMKACQCGDVMLIRQILDQKRGNLNDQVACTGKTALLLAIYGKHFEATKCLLQFGADPNVSDDDQVTPLFATAGMNPSEHEYFEQLPPTWAHWLDTFRLLVERGASLHETVRGRHVANLNIIRNDQPPKTLEYLRLLAAEQYLHIETATGQEFWSALQNALRSRSDAVDALKILVSTGVDLCKIMDDGRTALHFAAQWCLNSEPLEYLYSVGSQNLVNKQDCWGWTPLHYAAIARNSAVSTNPFSKVVSLLQKKAGAKILGGQNPCIYYDQPEERFTPFELLSFARPERYMLLITVLEGQGLVVNDRDGDEAFLNAQIQDP